jgi:murein hydrolase activator
VKTRFFHALIALAMLLPATVALGDPEREELEARLAELQDRISEIRVRLDRDLSQRDEVLDSLADAERRVSEAERLRRQTLAEIEGVSERIDDLNDEQELLAEQVRSSALALGRQLMLVYRQGGQSRLKTLLNQDDPRQFQRQLAYHGYLTRARVQVQDQLVEAMSRLEDNRRDLESRRAELEMLAQQQQQQIETLEIARADREDSLAGLDQRIQSRQEELDQARRDAAELSALLDELALALADIPPELEVPSIMELRGQLPHPVEGPLRRRFGDSRGAELTWNGWLISADEGTDVRAVGHGRVAYADWLRGYGLILIVDHGDEIMSLYAHNEALLRDVGDWVRPGDVIASVGNSGGATEVGLYFELRQGGRPVDPRQWLE